MKINTPNFTIDRTWSLFLDRDGVINEEQVGSYVTQWNDFHFCAGAQEAMRQFSNLFGRIVVVTNQRGVGKGLMTLDDLKSISNKMVAEVVENGGRIDKVYAATSLHDSDHNRKPNTGMGFQAKEDFPEIDFRKSIMVGNSMSDMEFGKRLNMKTIFITTKHEPFVLPHDLIDMQYSSLIDWTKTLTPSEELIENNG